MTKRSIAVILLIETDDARVFPENSDASTVEATAALRRAVLENLPQTTRIVGVMDEDLARLMFAAHETAVKASGLSGLIRRPHRDYRAPGDKVPPHFPGDPDSE